MNLLAELKRRNVLRMAGLYLVAAWLIVQVAGTLLPMFGAPEWLPRSIVILLTIGFIPALIFAWVFQLTPQGLKREQEIDESESLKLPPENALNFFLIIALALAVGWILLDQFYLSRSVSENTRSAIAEKNQSQAETEKSVAVLPFVNLSSDAEQEYFADGLTEEILNSLAALPDLLVTARTSSFFFKGKELPVKEIADRLGVANILEGSVRRSGERIRITAQLIRAKDGFHLWSNTYDRTVDDTFKVQSDIAQKVASALNILLDEKRKSFMESGGVRNPEAFAIYQKGLELYRLAHSGAPQIETLRKANVFFEQAAAMAPQMWATSFMESDLYTHLVLELAAGKSAESLGLNPNENPLDAMQSRLGTAMKNAPNESVRSLINLTQRFFSDNWTGLKEDLIKTVELPDSCGYSMWLHGLGYIANRPQQMMDYFLRGARCNPLETAYWLHAATFALNTGQAELALTIVDQGANLADEEGDRLHVLRTKILLALNRIEDARAGLSAAYTPNGRLLGSAFIAAHSGNAEQFASDTVQLLKGNAYVSSGDLIFAALMGDRDTANKMAAEIDAHIAGPALLIDKTYFCACGAPFDIEKTPHLKAQIAQAGFSWPPTSPIQFPLKTW